MELNKIIQWDCIEVLKTLDDNSIDLVLTDPPYKFHRGRTWIGAKRKYLTEWMPKIWTNEHTDIYTDEFIELLLQKLKKPNMLFFCNKGQIKEVLALSDKYKLNFDILVLCKTCPAPLCNNQWLPDKEYAIHLYKGIPVYWNYKTKRTFRTITNWQNKKIPHPTVKPLQMVEDIVKNVSKEWDVILDCYMGSGTTAVACKKNNRNFIGIEILPEFVELAEKRLKELDIEQQALF